jgi:AraC family transcriptional regulator
MPSAAPIMEELRKPGDSVTPTDWRRLLPVNATFASDQLGWSGVEAARLCSTPACEFIQPPISQHMLVLYVRPPDEMELQFADVDRHIPPSPGSIALIPAGTPARVRSNGCKDHFHIFLEPKVLARVAADAFELDPARVSLHARDAMNLPQLRAVMLAVSDELAAGGLGGPLAVEALANLLAVHLIRNASAAKSVDHRTDAALPQEKLRTVIQYIREQLDVNLTLEQMAASVHLSAYHFARQFKAATGLPPHQYVIARRVELAQQLLQPKRALPLSEIAARAGFSNQSKFSAHFKRIVGVTPRQFRESARRG